MPKYTKNGLQIEVDKPQLELLDEYSGRRRMYRLKEDFTIRITYASSNACNTITVPAGFKTDLATLPIFIQIFLGNRDNYAEPAIFHDFLCVTHTPRFMCNAMMRNLMMVMDYPYWKRVAIYRGLMWFGYGSPFSKFCNFVANLSRKVVKNVFKRVK